MVFVPLQPMSSYWRYIPLITPAFKEKYYEVDASLIQKRVMLVAIPAIVNLVASLFIASTSLFIFSAICLTFTVSLVLFKEHQIAEKYVNQQILDEYLKNPNPSKLAIHRIQSNLKMAQSLINFPASLTKTDPNGIRLLDPLECHIDVFKLFIKQGFSIKDRFKTKGRYGSVLENVITMKNTDYLEYLLETKKIQPASLDANQQVDLWMGVKSEKVGHLLKKYDFDVNVRGSDNYTPLMQILKEDTLNAQSDQGDARTRLYK